MNSGETCSVGGVTLSEPFVREIRRHWQDILRESPNAVVDVQRTRRVGQDEPADNEWSVYFLLENVFHSEDVFSLQGMPIHLSPKDRELLAGKLLDFEDYKVVVR
jgi:hypothetical protein